MPASTTRRLSSAVTRTGPVRARLGAPGAAAGRHQPRDRPALPDRAPARRGRLRPGLPGAAARALVDRARRSSASRSARASTAGCARRTSGSCSTAIRARSASSTRSRCWRRTAACSTASRSSTRGTATCARSCTRTGKGWPERDGAARDRRHPRRCSASCTAARCCTATSRR